MDSNAASGALPVLPSGTHYFQWAFHAVPTGILIVNSNGNIVMANKHLLGLFRYSESELLGQPIELLLPPRVRAMHPGLVRAFF